MAKLTKWEDSKLTSCSPGHSKITMIYRATNYENNMKTNTKDFPEPQFESISSVLQHSAFSVVQLSHLYMTTGKTIALTIWTFVSKVRPVLFNTLSRFAMAVLPRSK